jgi:proteasome accessory factor C
MPDLAGRVRRLLSLIPYVMKHQGVDIGDLCDVFEISRDQLMKDLNLIFMCGQPDYTPADLMEVDIDGDYVYIRMADYFARPLRFTPAELSGLYLACSSLVKLSGPSSSPALVSATDKIAGALGGADVSQEDIDEKVEIHSVSPEHEVVAELSRAADGFRVVEMEYYTYGRDDMTRRRVHPLSLEFGMGHWYLWAWDEKRGETRVFRVDRIKNLETTEETFEPPRELKEEDRSPFEVTESKGTEVRLRVHPSLARWAREQPIFKETEEDGDYLICKLNTAELAWVERELLSFGPKVEILSPSELKERLRDRVRNLLSIYED